MSSTSDQQYAQLLAEVERLRQQQSKLAKSEEELRAARVRIAELEGEIAAKTHSFAQECEEHTRALQELKMAQLIVERSPVILFRRLHGDDPRLEYISDNLRQLGYLPEEFLSGEVMFRDIVHPDDQDRVREEIEGYARDDVEEYTMYYRCTTRSGEVRWVEDQTSVVRDENGEKTHNQGVLFDITERKLAEDELKKSEEKFRRIVETAGEGFVLMDQELTIIDMNDAYCDLLGYSRQELLGKSPLDLAAEEFREHMMANREEILAKEKRKFEGTLVTKSGRHLPVLIHGNTLRDDHGDIIGNMAFVTDMTEHKKALMLAGEVQKSLLPKGGPQVQGLDIAGRNVSCDEIGGDYYDFIWRREIGDGPVSVVVGDISGHGVDSALLMTTARAFLRMRASQPGTIAEIVSAMNRHLARDVLESGRFMTLFYLSLDCQDHSLEWVRAGHDPALLYDPESDTFEELMGSGIALGVVDDAEYSAQSRKGLKNGEIIAIGTDGIWEAFNREGEMFGKPRLRELIKAHADEEATVILDKIYEDLKRFTAGRRHDDDITLVIVKVAGLVSVQG